MRSNYYRLIGIIFAVCTAVFALSFSAGASGVIATGDADLNGIVNTADARLALRRAVGLEKTMNANGILACDVNFDGRVTSEDARIILRVVVKLEGFSQHYITVPGKEENGTDDKTDPSIGFFEDSDAPIPNFFEAKPPAAPAIKDTTPDTFTFISYGYGHGVGMSQYGAVLLSKQKGFRYGDIIAYYYTRTELASEKPPAVSFYPGDSGIAEVPTEELVARIVQMEIGGITDDAQALRAIAVAVYTNLKRLNFNVNVKYTVGYAVSSYDKCSPAVKNAVKDVLGQYIIVMGDKDKKPIEAVYSALNAGHSASSQSVWGGYLSYLQPVNCSFEMQVSSFISQVTVSSSKLKEMILAYDPEIILSDDPSEWLEILSHSASVDKNRGYVNKIRVGNKMLSGYGEFYCGILGGTSFLRSHCFTVTYTPAAAS